MPPIKHSVKINIGQQAGMTHRNFGRPWLVFSCKTMSFPILRLWLRQGSGMHGSPPGMEISLRDTRLRVLSGGYRQGSSSSIQETAVSSVSSVMSTAMSSRVVLSFSSLWSVSRGSLFICRWCKCLPVAPRPVRGNGWLKRATGVHKNEAFSRSFFG